MCDVSFLPDIPAGQTDVILQKWKSFFAGKNTKKKNHNSLALINSKMELTFALRKKTIMEEAPLMAEIMIQWLALFMKEQVSA